MVFFQGYFISSILSNFFIFSKPENKYCNLFWLIWGLFDTENLYIWELLPTSTSILIHLWRYIWEVNHSWFMSQNNTVPDLIDLIFHYTLSTYRRHTELNLRLMRRSAFFILYSKRFLLPIDPFYSMLWGFFPLFAILYIIHV